MRKYEGLIEFRAVVFADDEEDAFQAMYTAIEHHDLPHIIEVSGVSVGRIQEMGSEHGTDAAGAT